MRAFFKDDSFDFLTRIALGCASSGCAEVGEVFAAIDGIRDGHADDWVDHWRAAGERLETEAGRRRNAGHRASAAAASIERCSTGAAARFSHAAWNTGSSGSGAIGPKPCAPPRSCGPFMRQPAAQVVCRCRSSNRG